MHMNNVDALESGSVNFFCKSPDSTYFRLCGPRGLVTTTQLCPCGVKEAINNLQTNACGCVPAKLYL